jgi:23S rRNA pseudouridine1911/1915/1917 synthase
MQADPDTEAAEIDTEAPPEAAGQRADRFLADAAGLSRSRVKTLIEQGRAFRDGSSLTTPAEPVRAGARYRLVLPAPEPASPAPQAIPFPILFEDSHLLVLDKPAGLVVHPAPGNPDQTLVNALLAHCGDSLPGIGGEKRPGIVHRLDKDTSGVMVVAKSEAALSALSARFAARDLERAYLGLCWGEIEGAIGRDPRDRKRMAVVARGGKAALTRYRVLQRFYGAASWLECRLATGRTHQIRVHLAHRGHPLVGDPVYLRRVPAVSRLVPEPARQVMLDFPRQALHAAVLGFVHPITGAALRFETKPPDDLQALLRALKETG